MSEVVTSENRAEWMSARMRIEPEAPKAPDPAQQAAQTDPVAEADPAPEPEEVTEDHGEAKKKTPLAQRFSEVTAARRQAEEKAAAAEARATAAEAKARELEAKVNPPKADPIDPELGPKPKPADYTDVFEYAEDLAEWTSNKALTDRDKSAKEAAARAEAQKVNDAFQKRVAAAKAELPDYAEVIASASHLGVSDAVKDAIMDSEIGPKILYHLATHEDVVEQLNSNPKAALRVIGRLEAQLEKPATQETKQEPKPRVKLPDPVTPIRAGGAGNDDRVDSSGQFTGSYAQFKALRAAGKLS